MDVDTAAGNGVTAPTATKWAWQRWHTAARVKGLTGSVMLGSTGLA